MRIVTRWPASIDAEVKGLLASTLGKSATSRIDEVLKAYKADTGDTLMVAVDKDGVVGCVGFRAGDAHTVVQHLAIKSETRRNGIARRLLTEVLVRHRAPMEAETDDTAVGYYRRLGFNVTPIWSNFADARRYRCSLATGTKAAR